MLVGDTCSGNKAEALTGLEREATRLEAKLKEVRASAVTLRAGLLAEQIATDGMTGAVALPEERDESKTPAPLPSVLLAELSLQHPLRRKWSLFSDYPETAVGEECACDTAIRDDLAQEGQLRLFGLLTNGEPWECSVVYSHLMNDGGITLGRDAAHADVVISDASVSRCHARLELTGKGLVVTDENSTNGTGVNDMMLTNYDRQVELNDGDLLNIAAVNLFVELI